MLTGYIRALKGALRRRKDALLPGREMREYQHWRARRLHFRAARYTEPPAPGLLSIITPVWNGSPVEYLKTLADGIAAQNETGACEWVIFDNGCTNSRLISYLQKLKERKWIQIIRSEQNVGIVKGLRRCLEQATGRYILPVDGDDFLYPDALRIITSWINKTDFPALLYTDEDKIIGKRFYQPYLKPDWDPVLFLNSAYIAHLGVIDRAKALEFGAYTDPAAEGSADWDLFVRFLIAGHCPVHIPEVVYSWRVHGQSTADDAASKPYIHSSQRAVLQRFLDARPDTSRFRVEYSSLLGGAAHWHFTRSSDDSPVIETRIIDPSNATLSDIPEREYVRLLGADVLPDQTNWQAEALSIFELHPDTVMIGGRIRNSQGTILEAARHFGFGGLCGCPDRGRAVDDPGYFAQTWKQRSTSAVFAQYAVVRSEFLRELMDRLPSDASLAFLGAWAGALALRRGKRVVYSPFLSGISDLDWEGLVSESEKQLFRERNSDLIPDHRFYPACLSSTRPYALGDPKCRES